MNKVLLQILIKMVLSWVSKFTSQDLAAAVSITKVANEKFSSGKDKREFAIESFKTMWPTKQESSLRFLLESAVVLTAKK